MPFLEADVDAMALPQESRSAGTPRIFWQFPRGRLEIPPGVPGILCGRLPRAPQGILGIPEDRWEFAFWGNIHLEKRTCGSHKSKQRIKSFICIVVDDINLNLEKGACGRFKKKPKQWKVQFVRTCNGIHFENGACGRHENTNKLEIVYSVRDCVYIYIGIHMYMHTLRTVGVWGFDLASVRFAVRVEARREMQ